MKLDKNTILFIQVIVFNVAETMLIFLIGLTLNLGITYIILMMVTFILSRCCFGATLHFKAWYKCLIWSLLILFSLFTILKISLPVSIVFTIFAAFIMTGKANMKDWYLWNNHNEPSKYQDVADYVKYHELDDRLLEFEAKIKNRDIVEYKIYKYRFKDGKTFGEISSILDIGTPKISIYLDKIAFAIRIYCDI